MNKCLHAVSSQYNCFAELDKTELRCMRTIGHMMYERTMERKLRATYLYNSGNVTE